MKIDKKYVAIILLGCLVIGIGFHFAFYYLFERPMIINYLEEPKLIGTYQLVKTLGYKSKRYITIEKTDTMGRYKIRTYRDFTSPYHDSVFYCITMPMYIEYDYRKKEFIEYNPKYNGHLNEWRFFRGDLFQKDLFYFDCFFWRKISNKILTEKELNTNHYPVKEIDDMEWTMSDWVNSIRRQLKQNYNL